MAGRPRNVETPEQMWELFCEYAAHIKRNPILKQDFVGKDGEEVYRKLEKPLTLDGFENYCYDIVGCVEQYFKNQDGLYEQFIPICTRIRKEIRQDQITGGMAGIYNPSITQRLNGLTEKQELKHEGTIEITMNLNE